MKADAALEHARRLFRQGEVHDALEAAQAACELRPHSSEAWWLLARITRHTGLPGASDDAFRRAAALSKRRPLPHRVSPAHLERLVARAAAGGSPDARRRLGDRVIEVQPLPSPEEIRAGTSPDAVSAQGGPGKLVLYQVNLENRSGSEAALENLIGRTLSRA